VNFGRPARYLGRIVGQVTRHRSGAIGLTLAVTVMLLALIGPLFAPHGPSDVVGPPFASPGGTALVGTDFLGRDVLSRVLWGGRSLLGMAVGATFLGYAIGVTGGLFAGYRRTIADPILMRTMDVILSFPPLIFLLVLATGTSPNTEILLLGVGVVLAPGATRIVRAATQVAAQRGYVEAAVARGEKTSAILRRELFPSILNTVLADAGIRFTSAILLIAAVSFLGLGLQPPAADWALMISENRSGMTLQPWTVALPALLIALLTVAVNMVADAFARSAGTSTDKDAITR
jgi:peptide/nickel transport system permease protein